MDAVLRSAAVYLFLLLLLVFRIIGRRALSQITTFDLSMLQRRSKTVDKLIDGVPLVIVEDGRPLEDRMRKARVEDDDVLEQARGTQGLERMDQIKYAVLERDGSISIIPR